MLALLIGAGTLLWAQNADLNSYSWTTGDVVPRHENAFVEFNGEFYLIGGRGLNLVNVFNPEINTWKTKSKTPVKIHHFQPIVYDNAIYIIGGLI